MTVVGDGRVPTAGDAALGGGVPFPSTAPGSTCPFGLVPELGAELALVLQQIMLRHFVPSALPRP